MFHLSPRPNCPIKSFNPYCVSNMIQDKNFVDIYVLDEKIIHLNLNDPVDLSDWQRIKMVLGHL